MTALIRVWSELAIEDIKEHLLVVGELSAECFSCHTVGLDIDLNKCPSCKTSFKYVGFRRKIQPSYLKKIRQQNPQIVLIDFEDFKKAVGEQEAKKFLDI